MPRGDDADLAARLREGQDMVRKGRALIRAAENLGARTELDPFSEPENVDFGALCGKSAEARAEALYLGRRIRDRLFPDGLFTEPAWDILLALFLAQRDGGAVVVETVFVECRLSSATGLRFIALLDELGLIDDRTSEGDARKRIALSQSGVRLMKRFFELTDIPAAMPRAVMAPRWSGLFSR